MPGQPGWLLAIHFVRFRTIPGWDSGTAQPCVSGSAGIASAFRAERPLMCLLELMVEASEYPLSGLVPNGPHASLAWAISRSRSP